MSSSSSSSSSAASSASASLLAGCTSASSSSFFLTSTPTYRVHPLVVFSILDHYQRRNDGQVRVVGTLLGQVSDDGAIEVKQAFPVPHEEEDESATVHMDYHHSMLALYKQVSPKDVVVGWYSTAGSSDAAGSKADAAQAKSSATINYITSLMHEMYRAQLPASSPLEPLHLSVDVSMKGGMKVSGFVNSVVRGKAAAGSTAGADLLANFQPVPVELYAYAEERIGVDALISGVPDDDTRLDAPATFLTDAENVEAAVVKLLECLETLEQYVEAAAAGKLANPDPALGQAIHSLLASLPALDAASFTAAFATHMQDLLAVVYLANMTKSQLAIADKANTML